MAKIDKDLVGALNKAKTKQMHFALVEKKAGSEGTLIVYKDPVPQAKITEAQDALGGGKIYKGRCFTDPATGELIFETDTDPPSVATLKAVIRRDAGQSSLKLNSRKGKPKVTIDDVMNVVTDRENKVKKRLDDITRGDAFKRSLSLGGIVADTLKKQEENIKKSIERQDFKKAEKELDDLKKLAENPTDAM
jgi:hypothetical protein